MKQDINRLLSEWIGPEGIAAVKEVKSKAREAGVPWVDVKAARYVSEYETFTLDLEESSVTIWFHPEAMADALKAHGVKLR